MAIGSTVEGRTAPAPALSPEEQQAFIEKATALAPAYRTEILPP